MGHYDATLLSSMKLCVTHNRVSGEILNFVATCKFFVLRFGVRNMLNQVEMPCFDLFV